jgi:uncharacterized protein (DUF2164 family)
MAKIQRKWDFISEEKRKSLIKEIIAYFKTNRDLEMGVLAAEDILDFFLQALGEDIYNKAIENSKKAVKQNFEDLEIDLDLLLNR